MLFQKIISLFLLGSYLIVSPCLAQGPFGNLDDLGADSSLFIGGSSVMLLEKGNVEVNLSSTLNTFILGRQRFRESSPFIDRFRSTTLINRADVYLGTSETGRWDLGLRTEYTRRRFDNGASSSPFAVLEGQQDNPNFSEAENDIDNSFGGLSRVGIRFRLKPFTQNNKFTVTGGYSIGTIKSERLQQNLNATSDQMDLSMIYFKDLNPRSFYYVAVSGFFDPKNKVDLINNYTLAGTLAFINLSLNNRVAFYPGLSYAISAEPPIEASGQKGLVWTSRRFTGFLGGQLQFNRRLLLNASFNMGITSRLSNPWVEIIPRSETTVNLFLRVLI